MSDTGSGLKDVVARLEQQHSAIVRALAALRGMESSGGIDSPAAVATPAAKKKRGMTPEGRARLVAALKRRWAAKKKGAKKA